MNEELLTAIASTVLSQIKGRGAWRKYTFNIKGEIPDDFMVGLAVGDFVYCYDDYQLWSRLIAVVHRGVGYYIDTDYERPRLVIACNSHYRTKQEAVEANYDVIKCDMEYKRNSFYSVKEAYEMLTGGGGNQD